MRPGDRQAALAGHHRLGHRRASSFAFSPMEMARVGSWNDYAIRIWGAATLRSTHAAANRNVALPPTAGGWSAAVATVRSADVATGAAVTWRCDGTGEHQQAVLRIAGRPARHGHGRGSVQRSQTCDVKIS